MELIVYFLLIVILVVLVTVLIRAEFREQRKKIYVVKPISTFLLLIIASLPLLSPQESHVGYTIAILLGLLFSYGGDIALMLKTKQMFIIGLILFLAAHIVYTVTFVCFNGFFIGNLPVLTLLTILAMVVYLYLYSGLEKMKLPVLSYVIVISVMVYAAISTFRSEFFNYRRALFCAVGACLFYISDLMLAINKFRRPFRYHRISLAFYYGGQLLIAMSTGFF